MYFPDFWAGSGGVFHAADGNLHPLVLFDANVPGGRSRNGHGRKNTGYVAAGGTVTGEHGVGVEKLDTMCVQFSSEELEQFFRLKAAVDPKALLNPGKVFQPSPAVENLAACMFIEGGYLSTGWNASRVTQ